MKISQNFVAFSECVKFNRVVKDKDLNKFAFPKGAEMHIYLVDFSPRHENTKFSHMSAINAN